MYKKNYKKSRFLLLFLLNRAPDFEADEDNIPLDELPRLADFMFILKCWRGNFLTFMTM